MKTMFIFAYKPINNHMKQINLKKAYVSNKPDINPYTIDSYSIKELIEREAVVKPLNPPKFEVALVDCRVKGIIWRNLIKM